MLLSCRSETCQAKAMRGVVQQWDLKPLIERRELTDKQLKIPHIVSSTVLEDIVPWIAKLFESFSITIQGGRRYSSQNRRKKN